MNRGVAAIFSVVPRLSQTAKTLLVVACFGMALILSILSRRSEPQYQGKNVTTCLNDWATNTSDKLRSGKLLTAVRHMGPDALPFVLRNVALNDSSWYSNYARVHPMLPGVVKRLVAPPRPLLNEMTGANAFSRVGSNSIPYAIKCLKHDSPAVRRSAAWGLASLRRQTSAANRAIPALIIALQDKDDRVVYQAALALGEMGSDASNAVITLSSIVKRKTVRAETNRSASARATAVTALRKIGRPAAVLPVLELGLGDSDPQVRRAAAYAISQISRTGPEFSATNPTLPAMINALQDKDDRVVCIAARALGEMGSNASNAVASLSAIVAWNTARAEMNRSTNARGAAVLALGKIGPPAVALPVLKLCLEDPDPYVRRMTVDAIWRIQVESLQRQTNQ